MSWSEARMSLEEDEGGGERWREGGKREEEGGGERWRVGGGESINKLLSVSSMFA